MSESQDQPQQPQQSLDFSDIYRHGQKHLLRFLVRQTGHSATERLVPYEALEDIAQHAWLRTWTHWQKLASQPERAVYAHIYTTARNLLTDYYRHQQMRLRRGELRMTDDRWEWAQEAIADDATPDGTPGLRLLLRDAEDDLHAAIERSLMLAAGRKVGQRKGERDHAVLAAWIDDETEAATAARMGISTSAVKMLRWRMRQALQRHLIEQLGRTEPTPEEVAS